MNFVKIRRLSTLVDKLDTNTVGALTQINAELIAMHAMIMQNRSVLQILLMKEGSVFRVLRIREWSTFIPDNSSVI